MATIIFDVGGVLVRGSLFSFLRKAYDVLGMAYTFIPPEVEIIPREFFLGKMGGREAFEKALRPMSDEEYAQIEKLWLSTWKLDETVFSKITQLHEEGHTLVVLSNSDPLNFPKYLGKGYFDMFDILIFSHEVGMLKPDKAIYDLAISQSGSVAADCLFIDDQERCLIPAKELGMRVVHYKDVTDLERLI